MWNCRRFYYDALHCKAIIYDDNAWIMSSFNFEAAAPMSQAHYTTIYRFYSLTPLNINVFINNAHSSIIPAY